MQRYLKGVYDYESFGYCDLMLQLLELAKYARRGVVDSQVRVDGTKVKINRVKCVTDSKSRP